ncbi:MAG TPA: HAMP domain-containing sensor histidine kinase [Gemmatimonadales bacterium]|nr:HAMP domain-containing sensor histidine kinase [Gemmatimonadales bacterium]
MASIRVKLTSGYAVALIGSFTLFAAVLWGRAQTSTQQERERIASLRVIEPYVGSRAEIAAGIIRERATLGSPVVEDSLGVPSLREDVAALLTSVPEYLMVFDTAQRMIYSSSDVRALNRTLPADSESRLARRDTGGADFERIVSGARRLQPAFRLARLRVDEDDVLITARFMYGTGGDVERVVAGARVGSFLREAETTRERELLVALLATTPVILVASIAWAWILAGRTVRPIDRIIDDLEAISDGRSLHRRLKVDSSGDELARLTTTLNAMLGRLENYFGALRRFTADASHELKTPLAVLRADVERAMAVTESPGDQLVYLEEALAETTRMADLVEQLLTLARADEGRFDLHREPVALEPLVRDVYETALILGEASGIEVELLEAAPVTVMGDRVRLRQLFLNLVTNAIKYTSRGGEVEMQLSEQDGNVVFSVRDTGMGIAAADLPHIFERFWRADRVRSRAAERSGFGLGLAISQWIAQAHGGSLTATSRLTRGSTFSVTLPVAAEPVREQEIAAPPGPAHQAIR